MFLDPNACNRNFFVKATIIGFLWRHPKPMTFDYVPYNAFNARRLQIEVARNRHIVDKPRVHQPYFSAGSSDMSIDWPEEFVCENRTCGEPERKMEVVGTKPCQNTSNIVRASLA